MMKKLDGSFIRGYTKAILDIQRFFEGHSEGLSHNKLYNRKGIEAILKFIVENREELRETGDIEDIHILVKKDSKKVILSKRGSMQ